MRKQREAAQRHAAPLSHNIHKVPILIKREKVLFLTAGYLSSISLPCNTSLNIIKGDMNNQILICVCVCVFCVDRFLSVSQRSCTSSTSTLYLSRKACLLICRWSFLCFFSCYMVDLNKNGTNQQVFSIQMLSLFLLFFFCIMEL